MHWARKLTAALAAVLVAGASIALSVETASAATTAPAAHHQAISAVPTTIFKPSAEVLNGYTKTYSVPAPAAECEALKLAKGCENTITTHADPAVLIPNAAAKIHNAAIKPNENVYNVSGWQEECAALSCGVWHAKESSSFNFTGGWVEDAGNNCGDYGGIGYSFSITFCGNWNNGATSQSSNGGEMYDGEDVNIALIAHGIPVSTTYWMQNWCNVDGDLWYDHN